jgi:hypothetical protein
MGIGVKTLRTFFESLNIYDAARAHWADIDFLQCTGLFGSHISSATHSRLAMGKRQFKLGAGDQLVDVAAPWLYLVRAGELRLLDSRNQTRETIGPGGCVGILPDDWRVVAERPSTLLALKMAAIERIPIVQWKLREMSEKRVRLETAGG